MLEYIEYKSEGKFIRYYNSSNSKIISKKSIDNSTIEAVLEIMLGDFTDSNFEEIKLRYNNQTFKYSNEGVLDNFLENTEIIVSRLDGKIESSILQRDNSYPDLVDFSTFTFINSIFFYKLITLVNYIVFDGVHNKSVVDISDSKIEFNYDNLHGISKSEFQSIYLILGTILYKKEDCIVVINKDILNTLVYNKLFNYLLLLPNVVDIIIFTNSNLSMSTKEEL